VAELTIFGYHPGNSYVHRLDSRLKFFLTVMFSLAGLGASPWGLMLLSAVLAASVLNCRLPVKSAVREIRLFLLLIVFVVLARALATPGKVVFHFWIFQVTREGAAAGLLVGWRLLTVVFLGLGLVATSRPADIRAAVAWFLRPVPFVPAKRVATMIGLMMRFVPVIFDQIKATVDAQRARGVENRKNPLYRIKTLGIPLIWRTFDNADKLVDAMSARCYHDDRTGPVYAFGRRDTVALIAAIPVSLLIIGL